MIRQELHDAILQGMGQTIESKKLSAFQFLYKKFSIEGDTEVKNILGKFMRDNFLNSYFRKWKSCQRVNERFEKKFKDWLKTEIIFPAIVYKHFPGSSSSG